MAEITVNDIKEEIPRQDYETLTLGEDAVALRCLLKAKVWVKGAVRSTGNVYDEDVDVQRICVIKRTLYELFSFSGTEKRAEEKHRDCTELLETYYGSIKTKFDAKDNGKGPALASVVKADIHGR